MESEQTEAVPAWSVKQKTRCTAGAKTLPKMKADFSGKTQDLIFPTIGVNEDCQLEWLLFK
ncbi:MAG: hypothetical protein ACTHLW_06165 [Verrucomicrobiota bacterium]